MKNNRKLNILQIIPSLNSGGVERGTLEMADYITKKGHSSYVISGGGRLVVNLLENGSTHIKLNIGKKSIFTFFLIPKLISIIVNRNIDIVHVRSRFPAWIVYIGLKFIKKSKRPHFITTVHGYNSVSLYSKIMLMGDKVIVVSKSLLDFLKNNYAFDKKKTILIYRGVPKNLIIKKNSQFNAWKKNWLQNFKINKSSKILLLPTRISRHKGIEFFLDLILKLKMQKINVKAFIVGDAKSLSYLNQVKKKIRKFDLENEVYLTGYCPDIYKIMSISNITFSLSTLPEAFGRIAIESIKIGTPVIGFSHGGVGEQLELIFPEGIVKDFDTQELFDKTKKFLKTPPNIKPTRLFTLESMQKKTLDVYKSFNNYL